MEAKGRELLDRQRWQDARDLSREALANCNRVDWCAKDQRYQGLFHTNIGQAEERLGHKEAALEHYRKAFYAYPLFFTENYFRMLRDAGMYRLLRQEIDVKLASNETAHRTASAVWLSPQTSGCGAQAISGSYRFRLKTGGVERVAGKAVLSQSGCVVSADIPLPQDKGAGGLLHFRGDVHSSAVNLLFGPPCVSNDRGQLTLGPNQFTVNAERPSPPQQGCFQGRYTMEFVKD